MPRLVVAAALAAALVPTVAAPAQVPKPSAAKERAEGDPSGAIRALGAAGYNDHEDRKPPPVTIPRLVPEKPRAGGLPHGTR